MYKKLSCYQLAWPCDWNHFFSGQGPLIVEVGFGNGDYLIHLAKTKPDARIIGFEIANKSLAKAERKIRTQGLDHLIVVHSPAETAFHHLFEPDSIDEIHINYPDPWFKSRHSGKRLMKRETLDLMLNRLKPNGMFYLATDVAEYAEMSDEILRDTRQIDNQLEQAWVEQLPDRIVTKYEARGVGLGNKPHYFIYKRNETASVDFPVIKDLEMPHLILETPMSLAEILNQFKKQTHHVEDIHIIFLDAYGNEKTSTLLFEANVIEPSIEQHVAIMMMPKKDQDHYILRLNPLGHPRATVGLHQAVQRLGEWICSLDESAHIVALKLKAQDSL